MNCNIIDNLRYNINLLPAAIYKSLLAVMLLMMVTVDSHAASTETAGSVLKHVVKRMSESPVKVRFAINASGVDQIGDMTLSGKKFRIKTADMSIWYDGKTQWTLSPRINEVNITSPTVEEVSETNPLVILSSLSSSYDTELGAGRQGSYTLKLMARKEDSAVSSASVSVNSSSWYPMSIDLVTSTGQRFVITIITIESVKNITDDEFRFNKELYPGVQLIDLR